MYSSSEPGVFSTRTRSPPMNTQNTASGSSSAATASAFQTIGSRSRVRAPAAVVMIL